MCHKIIGIFFIFFALHPPPPNTHTHTHAHTHTCHLDKVLLSSEEMVAFCCLLQLWLTRQLLMSLLLEPPIHIWSCSLFLPICRFYYTCWDLVDIDKKNLAEPFSCWIIHACFDCVPLHSSINYTITCRLENRLDHDQLASQEASWSGSMLFSKKKKYPHSAGQGIKNIWFWKIDKGKKISYEKLIWIEVSKAMFLNHQIRFDSYQLVGYHSNQYSTSLFLIS